MMGNFIGVGSIWKTFWVVPAILYPDCEDSYTNLCELTFTEPHNKKVNLMYANFFNSKVGRSN